MAIPFEPYEIDDLDESVLEDMTQEELEEFRDRLLETMDDMATQEPDMDEEEEAYYEWEDRVNVLQDLMDLVDDRMVN